MDPQAAAPVRMFPAIEFTFSGPPADDAVDLLLALVDEAGPTGVVSDEARTARLFFATAEARDRATALVAAGPRPADVIAALPIDVPDEGWAERSQASLGAVRVGAIVIAPPWVPAEPGAVWITVMPSMGFGTGHHASTRLCLALLQSIDLTGRQVIDLGTGSGVLAAAAARCGAAAVRAIDDDADAVACARDTVARNDLGDRVIVAQGDLSTVAYARDRADVVLANLTGEMLMRSAAAIGAMASDAGHLVLGGIQSDEAARVTSAYATSGWRVHTRLDEAEWVGLRLARAASPAPVRP